ncbi:hypothetical protein B0H10DRAFT_1950706 [Mycena sp. CBHHK59/15]|nr:hypothetical protein B0H10DRAFT_1950706 [Mycena sp. CBHHK59/15]
MCRVGDWNLSQVSLISPEAIAGLRALRTANPALHAALTQTTEADEFTLADVDFILVGDGNDEADNPYANVDVYDDCDVPLTSLPRISPRVVLPLRQILLWMPTSEAVPLGRGQRKKTVARHYQGPTWEEH